MVVTLVPKVIVTLLYFVLSKIIRLGKYFRVGQIHHLRKCFIFTNY